MDSGFDYKVTIVEDSIEPEDCLEEEIKKSKRANTSWKYFALILFLVFLSLSVLLAVFMPLGLFEILIIFLLIFSALGNF